MPPGLRERKKLRTREEIIRVAMDLFDQQGFAATTIAQIAEAADVAPRTVSSYFPAKEDLVFPREDEIRGTLEARLRDRHEGESAVEALRGWISEEQDRWRARDDEARCQHRIIAADPDLQAHKRAQLAQFEEVMAAAIALDLGLAPTALEPRMAAAATVAVLDRIGEGRHDAVEGGAQAAALEEEALRLVDRGLAFVTAGIAALDGREA